jgi:hypothetical protein
VIGRLYYLWHAPETSNFPKPPPGLGTQRLIDQLVQGVSQELSGRQTRWQRLKWSRKVHLRGLLLLILVILIAAVQRCSR